MLFMRVLPICDQADQCTNVVTQAQRSLIKKDLEPTTGIDNHEQGKNCEERKESTSQWSCRGDDLKLK